MIIWQKKYQTKKNN